MKLEQVLENEVIMTNDYNENKLFILVEGQLNFSVIVNCNEYITKSDINKNFLKEGFKKYEKISFIKNSFDLSHDLNSKNEFTNIR